MRDGRSTSFSRINDRSCMNICPLGEMATTKRRILEAAKNGLNYPITLVPAINVSLSILRKKSILEAQASSLRTKLCSSVAEIIACCVQDGSNTWQQSSI